MYLCTKRDRAQRQRIANAHLGLGATHHAIADIQAKRRQNIALLAVSIVQQGDPRAAIRIVLNARDFGRHAVLIALEVDNPVSALGATTTMPHSHAALIVAPAALA